MSANSEITQEGFVNGVPTTASLRASRAHEFNQTLSPMDPNMLRPAQYYIYVYSVADRELVRQLAPAIKNVIIPPRPKQTKGSYSFVRSVAHPFGQAEKDQNGADVVYYSNALGIVMDIICPGHTDGNLDAQLDKRNVFQQNNDYAQYGVFYSRRSPEEGGPLPEEIAAAEARKEKKYRGLLLNARAAEASNPASLYGDKNDAGVLTPDHHLAADYFGESFSWHKVSIPTETCELCGDTVKPGVAWHLDSTGDMCVRDWKRTVASGKRKFEDVPEELRWETPKKKKTVSTEAAV